MSDTELVIAIKKGDENAFKIMFNRYHKSVFAYMISVSKDNNLAADITQQAFIALWETKTMLNSTKPPKGYLFKIAYNRYIDYCRKVKREKTFIDEFKYNTLQQVVNAEDDLDKKLKKLKKVIEALPAKCQEILKLNKIEGLKYKEIAEHLDISQKTVESQMRIAFKKIRNAFSDDSELYLFALYSKYLNTHKNTG